MCVHACKGKGKEEESTVQSAFLSLFLPSSSSSSVRKTEMDDGEELVTRHRARE